MFFPFCIFPWCLPPPFPCYAINPKCLLANLSRVQFHPWREEERGGPSHQLVPLFILFRLGVSSWQQNRPIYFMAISSALTLSPLERRSFIFYVFPVKKSRYRLLVGVPFHQWFVWGICIPIWNLCRYTDKHVSVCILGVRE